VLGGFAPAWKRPLGAVSLALAERRHPMRQASAALIAALIAAAAPALAATGEDLFNDNCGGCHTLDAASQPTAPTLKGVYGRKIASLTDFDYSDALKARQGGVWDDATLNAFLADPQAFAKGTQMYGAAPDPGERQAIIDYLKTAK
jgi:cytochrome c